MGSADKFFGSIGITLFKGFVIERDIDPLSIDHSTITNILVVLRHQMGDLVTATPMLRSLKSAFSEAKLILVTKKSTRYSEIFTGSNKIADEVIEYENGFENFINVIKELRDMKIDLAVVPATIVFSSTNSMIAYYSRARYVAGVRSMDYEDNPLSYVFNIKNDFNWTKDKSHQIEKNLDIIRQLKIPASNNRIELQLNTDSRGLAEKFLTDNGMSAADKFICIHPGAAKDGNVWPAERFAELASRLSNEFGLKIIISEGPVDKKFADETVRILKEKFGIYNSLRHKGLLMTNLALISLSKLFITNDTGVMHLASGVDVPIIALFGPTKAYQWGPIGEKNLSVQAAGSKIENISVEEIYSLAVRLLHNNNI